MVVTCHERLGIPSIHQVVGVPQLISAIYMLSGEIESLLTAKCGDFKAIFTAPY